MVETGDLMAETDCLQCAPIKGSVCAIDDLCIKVIYLLGYLSESATKSVT
jgi:hypothetical protein